MLGGLHVKDCHIMVQTGGAQQRRDCEIKRVAGEANDPFTTAHSMKGVHDVL